MNKNSWLEYQDEHGRWIMLDEETAPPGHYPYVRKVIRTFDDNVEYYVLAFGCTVEPHKDDQDGGA